VTDGMGQAKPKTPVDLGRRVRWEQDKLGRLLIFDCSNNNRDEAYALLDAFMAALRPEPPVSVRVLVDLENAVHETGLTRRWKEAVMEQDTRVAKVALLRITSGMKVVMAAYRFYARVRGVEIDTKMVYFEDEARARAWLEGA
jgi:hypothetical protein